MARSEIERMYKNGLITEREYRRARGKKMADEHAGNYGLTTGPNGPGGAFCADGIADKKAQRNDMRGGGRTVEFGPNDAGHIDAAANRREFPKGTALKGKAPNVVAVGRSRNTKGWPTDAQVRRMSANEFHPDWYSDGPTRQ
jgi:hypothetical protein